MFAGPLFALLTACQPSTPSAEPAADVATTDADQAPAEKNGKKGKKGKKTAKAGKASKATEPPLGVPGEVTGTLALVEVAPAAPAEGAAATTTEKKTEAKLAMTFADGKSSDVSLGTMPGTCT